MHISTSSRENFKIMHSELIMYCQCIEYDLKRIFSAMSTGNFNNNMDMLETSNFGHTLTKLKRLDYSNGHPDLSESDYELLDQIREIRNYWCHQCYLDYVYISDDYRRDSEFQRLSRRLSNERNRLYYIHKKIEKLYIENYA